MTRARTQRVKHYQSIGGRLNHPPLYDLLALLVLIDAERPSLDTLQHRLGVSRSTVNRLIKEAREVGVEIVCQHESREYWYRVDSWGIFSRQAVRAFDAQHARARVHAARTGAR
jgi:biotin operon repressor